MNAAQLVALLGGRQRSRTTTWNPSDKATGLTLSNGNLTATSDASSVTAVRSTTTSGAGKRAFQATLSLNTTGRLVGIANGTYDVFSASAIGGDTNAVAYDPSTGAVTLNSISIATVSTAVNGDAINIVLDASNKLLWIRVNVGNWNASGSANPGTGVGGISLASMSAGPYYAIAGFGSVTTRSITANFWPAPPYGVQSWDQ